jgi:hypothetical protein
MEHRHHVAYLIGHAIQAGTVFFLAALIVLHLSAYSTRALELPNRRITLSSSLPGATATHDIEFDILSSYTLGSVVIEYCDNSPLIQISCSPPAGMTLLGANLSYQAGQTGFSIHPNTTVNRLVLTRPPLLATPSSVDLRLDSVVSSSGPVGTQYVRIFTYSSTDGTGAETDFGAVSYALNNPLTVQVYVPPFLVLCTGISVAPDCTSSVGSGVDLGELSKISANAGVSQFAAATNSFSGYVASIQGTTMTAGNKIINPLLTLASSQPGNSQFGINLRANTSPSIGADIIGSGSGSVAAQYNNPNQFKFNSGDVIASSVNSTEFNTYTISYLVNVSPSQSPGRYASTMTVIATTTF